MTENRDTGSGSPRPVSSVTTRTLARLGLILTALVHLILWAYLTAGGIRTIADAYRPDSASAQPLLDLGPANAGPVQTSLFLIALALVTVAALLWSDLPSVRAAEPGVSVVVSPTHAAAPLAFDRISDQTRRIVGGGRGAMILYFSIIVVAQDCRILVELTTSARSIPPPADRDVAETSRLAADLVVSVGAGVWEEVALFALPIALLTLRGWKGRHRLILIIAVAMVLRSGIHLYYGIGSIMVVPWMIGAVLLFRAVGSIWPLVAGHALFDVWVSVNNRLDLPTYTAQIAQHIVVLAGVALMWQSVRRVQAPRKWGAPHTRRSPPGSQRS